MSLQEEARCVYDDDDDADEPALTAAGLTLETSCQ